MSLGYFKKRRCPVQLSYSTTLPHTNARIIVFSRRYIIESKPKHRGDIEREHTVYSIEDDYEESMLRDRGRVVGKIHRIDNRYSIPYTPSTNYSYTVILHQYPPTSHRGGLLMCDYNARGRRDNRETTRIKVNVISVEKTVRKGGAFHIIMPPRHFVTILSDWLLYSLYRDI